MTKKKKNRNKIDGSFTALEDNLKESEAFKDLSIHAKWLYMEFGYRFKGDNRHHIIFTKEEAIKIMAYKTFKESRNILIERGIIDIIKRGGLEKRASIYGLSDRWKKYGTKDFIKVDIKKILPKICKTGFKKGNKIGRQSKKREHL
ncbi:hypothetical protein ES705_35347 [subsurface metagenome]